MNTIYKYPVHPDNAIQSVQMPEGAVLKTAVCQNETPVIYAAVTTTHKPVKRQILCIGTGWSIPAEVSSEHWFATVSDGGYVWHLFDLGEAEP